jgi:hypothetical protein
VDFSKAPCSKSRFESGEEKVWRTGIYDRIRDVVSLQGSLGIERMCHSASLSRAGLIGTAASDNDEEEMHVQSEVRGSLWSTEDSLAIGA